MICDMRSLVLAVIRFYQKTLSPDHGVVFVGTAMRCRFFPSCSQYAYEAIERFGLVRGTGKGILRILRCGPWSKGGIDRP